MKNIFSMDNPVFQAISRLGDMFILSFLWLVTSLPVFTLGASTTALLGSAIKIIRGRDTGVVKDYFKLFGENFKQSTVIFLIMAAVGALLAVDLKYWSSVGGDLALVFGGLSLALAIPFASTLIFVFPVQAVFRNKIRDTIRTAFLMSVRHPATSAVLIIFFAALSYVCSIYPIAAFFALVVGTGFASFLLAVRFTTVFAKYSPEIAEDIAKKASLPEGKSSCAGTAKLPKGTRIIR